MLLKSLYFVIVRKYRFVVATLLCLPVLVFLQTSLFASSHREAPLITSDPKADATDVFAFVSPDNSKTVTLIANYIPFQEPAGGPNFYSFDDHVLYEIKVDNDGDAEEDISYQFQYKTTIQNKNSFLYSTGPITSLTDPDWNIRQTYNLSRVTKNSHHTTSLGEDLTTPPVNIGPKSTPNYEVLQAAAIHTLSDGIKVFAGQSDDPFFVELGGLFDLLTIRNLPGNAGGGVDGLRGYNVHSLALQIPITQLTKDGSLPTNATDQAAVIGVWTTASRKSHRVLRRSGEVSNFGRWVQVSRLGAALVNEVVIPLEDKNRWNASEPEDDKQFANYVADPELGKLLNALYGVAVPPQGPFGSANERDDLLAIFLTGIPGLTDAGVTEAAEELRLNVAVPLAGSPNRFGVLGGDNQGYPNGRRLADDVTDISIRAVAGAAYPLFHPSFTPDPLVSQLGDGVDTNDKGFRNAFPYLALPTSGFDSVPHP